MDREKVIDYLVTAAEAHGCVEILNLFGKNLRVRLPFDKHTLAKQIVHINSFSARSRNALMRANLHDINSLVEYFKKTDSDENFNINSLGTKSYSQIKTILIVLSYTKMDINDKKKFWEYVLDHNIFHNS